MRETSLQSMLDVLCPLHVCLDRHGTIEHVGSAVRRLRPDFCFEGKFFLDVFWVQRPRHVISFYDFLSKAKATVFLELPLDPPVMLKGLLVPSPTGYVINMSFGYSLVEAVGRFHLTQQDFAATELATEMLYLVESNSSALSESRKLNRRLQGAKIAAEEQAYTDTLTGLKNRRALEHIVARMTQREMPFALMQIDLDHFKAVNDEFGHAAGDHVLQEVASILVKSIRIEDTVARIGGDEFLIVYCGVASSDLIDSLGERIISLIEKPIAYGTALCQISASVGTALSVTYRAPNLRQMMIDADAALYKAKAMGGGTHLLSAS